MQLIWREGEKGDGMRWSNASSYSDKTGNAYGVRLLLGSGSHTHVCNHTSHTPYMCFCSFPCLILSANVHATNNTLARASPAPTLQPFIQCLRQSQRLSPKPTPLHYKIPFGPNPFFSQLSYCAFNFFQSKSEQLVSVIKN